MPGKSKSATQSSSASNQSYRKIEDKTVKVDDTEFKITRAVYFTESNSYVFNLEFADINFYKLKIINGQNGWFISFPSEKAKDGKYYSYFYIPFTDDEKNAIIGAITG